MSTATQSSHWTPSIQTPAVSNVTARLHSAATGVGQGVRRLTQRAAERRSQRRAIAELKSLDNRTLKDLGLDRSEITSVIGATPRDRIHPLVGGRQQG